MRVLFVISTLRAGGAERVCALVASKFSEFHDVVLAKFDDEKPFYELSPKVRLLNLAYGADERGILGNIKKRVGKIFALRKLIKGAEILAKSMQDKATYKEQNSSEYLENGTFDVVISFLDSTNLLVLLSAIGLKTPIVISEHTSFDARLASGVFERLKRLLYPRASALSVLTKTDAKHYATYCKNVAVVHNPLFVSGENFALKKENLIIFVGRLVAVKNCEMFVRVAAKLSQNGYKFAIAGDGDMRENLENLSLELGANVEFLGNVSDMGELYSRAKILISTSRIEGLGNTLIEAIAYDVARVATKTSGALELIDDGIDGVICAQDDADAMSLAVLDLMQNEQKRAEICQKARAKLDEFKLDYIYERWMFLLKMAGV